MSASYTIEFTAAAAKQLTKLDRQAQRRIQAAIELLAETPRPPGAKKLVGSDGEWRVRTGDYRIVYEIHDRRLIVYVIRIGHRRDIYKSS
ncbi:type II toxin-antitoxin system RelE family toxin [Acaricomes phytoseiuli]|uniref:type II toxin-antitoxin system RelE family toxin n=1 Tax=Acaricomes phytoseiuli TaxID=291968 RepID=UPI0003803A3C|nr:type II toxin-antitoxin system RelE/ParE family toxin [Acaricomes phytoseiuli]